MKGTAAVALAAVLCCAAPRCGADNPWDGPYASGVALYRCDRLADGAVPDESGGAPLRLSGATALDTGDRRYGAASIRLSGGSLSAETVAWRGGDRSLEFFLKPERFPAAGTEAVLAAFLDAKGTPVHTLALAPDGGLRLSFAYADYLQERYAERTVLSLPAGTIAAGRWTHVAVHALAYYNMVRLSVDGVILGEEHGAMHEGDYRLVVGAGPGGASPFTGLLDEIRQARAQSIAPRREPQTWVNPASPAPAASDQRYFPNAGALRLYCPFDGSIAPAATRDPAPPLWRKKVPARFADGVHGRSLVLGCPLDIPARGNLRAAAGTFSCWVKVSSAPNEMGRIFKLGDNWDFMLSGDHGFYCYSRTGRHVVASDGWGALRNIAPGRWHHVALSWMGEWAACYVNGVRSGVFLIPEGLAPYIGDRTTVSLGDSWTEYGPENKAFIDELRVYAAALPPEEVANLYRASNGMPLVPVTAPHTAVLPCPGLRRIAVLADTEAAGAGPGAHVSARLADAAGRTVASAVRPATVCGAAEMAIDYPPVAAGEYVLTVEGGADGSSFRDVRTVAIAAPDWAASRTGLTDRVLPPWTPVAAGRDAASVWNRTYRMDGSGLFRQIECGGAPLLAGPMRIECAGPDGELLRPRAARTAPERRSATPAKAVYAGEVAAGSLRLSVVSEIEYDGCVRVSAVQQGGPAEISRLTLVIPLAGESARYINAKGTGIRERYLIGALPAAAGRVFASHIMPWCGWKTDPLKLLADHEAWRACVSGGKPVPKELEGFARNPTAFRETTSGSFLPYLWIGRPERGLCWFADDDRNWIRSAAVPAVEVVRTPAGAVEIRVNLAAGESPVRIEPGRPVVFGLMATPARPLDPAWRRDYWYRTGRILGFGYEFQSGRYHLGRGCPGAYGGEPYPWDIKRAQWLSAIFKKKGWLQIPYFEFTNTYDEITREYEIEWRQQPKAWGVQGGILPVRGYADWFCFNLDRYVRDVGIDGLYLDNVCPLPSLNPYADRGWRNAGGRLESGYNIWGLREMLRRIRTVFLDNGVERPWIQLHMTHANLIPAMVYADVLYDGEDFYYGPDDSDFMDRWPLDMLTAIDSPHAWGVPTHFLSGARKGTPEDWKKKYPGEGIVRPLRTELASLLLVDCKGGSWEIGGVFETLRRWGVDRPDAVFRGHWTGALASADPDVRAACHARPGGVLLIVSNFSQEVRTARIVSSDRSLLACIPPGAIAAEAESGPAPKGGGAAPPLHPEMKTTLERTADGFAVTVGPLRPRDFRLVAVAAP